MADVHDAATRSRNMAAIKSQDTKPEVRVRSYLHRCGLRFATRQTASRLPGKPDVVLPKWSAVLFVHGCFWHRHANCKYAVLPKSNVEFWTGKLERNRQRDRSNEKRLHELGWRVFVVWECGLPDDSILPRLVQSIRGTHGSPE